MVAPSPEAAVDAAAESGKVAFARVIPKERGWSIEGDDCFLCLLRWG